MKNGKGQEKGKKESQEEITGFHIKPKGTRKRPLSF
jgi:hypothetical protein